MKHPVVSVIITTKNEAEVLEDLLRSLISQSSKSFEIILVDNNSKDGTREIASRYTNRIFNRGPERSAQRNFGAKKALGSFLLFLDADMQLEEDVISQCLEKMEKTKSGAVVIPEISFGSTFWAKVKAYERSFYVGDEKIEAARFYRKDVFYSLGGFDEEITGPEDWEFSDRVRRSFSISRIKSHILHNEGSLGFSELMKKKYYYGKKTPVYLQKAAPQTVFSSKTLFFLRKSFYKKPKQIVAHPVLFCAMIVMLTSELAAGVLGVIAGFFND